MNNLFFWDSEISYVEFMGFFSGLEWGVSCNVFSSVFSLL